MRGRAQLPAVLALFVAGLFADSRGYAEPYPALPVRVIVPNVAGGGVDGVARPVSRKLAELWGQQVQIENFEEAGGTAGPGIVAQAPADGHTLPVSTLGFPLSAALVPHLPYSPLNDFLPVAPLTSQPYVFVVGKGLGVRTIADLVAAVKAQPGRLTFGSAGPATAQYLGVEKLNFQAGIKGRPIRISGAPEMINKTVADELAYSLVPVPLAVSPLREGRLVALAVSGARRSPLLPDVPTVAESGLPRYDHSLWYGMWAPGATPAAVVEKLSTDIRRVLEAPELREQLVKLGGETMSMPPAEFARFVRSEYEDAVRVLKAAGMRP